MRSREGTRICGRRSVVTVAAASLLALGPPVLAVHPEGKRPTGSGASGASGTTQALVDVLARSDGSTDDVRLASILDALRSRGSSAARAAETLSRLLSHRSRIYADRDKSLVVRLRAYILVTLSEIGFPSSALPALLDILAHVDPRQTAMEVGAAVRVVGSLGRRGCEFAPYLLDLLGDPLSEQEFSLQRYEPQFPPHEATTAQLEAVRALGRVCAAEDREVVAALRALAEPGGGDLDPRASREAQAAVALVLARRAAVR